jgi:hypothetical protein
MSQVVSRRPVTAEARLRSQASLYGICCGRSGTGTGFPPSTPAFVCQCLKKALTYSFIHQSPTLCHTHLYISLRHCVILIYTSVSDTVPYSFIHQSPTLCHTHLYMYPTLCHAHLYISLRHCVYTHLYISLRHCAILIYTSVSDIVPYSFIHQSPALYHTHLYINLRHCVILSIDSHLKIVTGLYIFYLWETNWREEAGIYMQAHL